MRYARNKASSGGLKEEMFQEWSYSRRYFDSTLVTRWNLVCARAIHSKSILAVITAATVVGCLFYSYISDRWGRKVALLSTVVTYVLGSSLSLAMPSPASFTALRVLASINAISTFNLSYIWAVEFIGPSKRTLVTTLMTGAFALACVSLGLIAWLTRTWLQFGLATSLPFVAVLSYWVLLAESPQWLLAHGRRREAEAVVGRMIRWEKRLPPGQKESSVALFRVRVAQFRCLRAVGMKG